MFSKQWEVYDRLDTVMDVKSVMGIILRSRGIESREAWNAFIAPPYPGEWLMSDLGISDEVFGKMISLLKNVQGQKRSVLVYGDYDADGVCASSILSERLEDWGFRSKVHIPDRRAEGYTMKVENMVKLLDEHPDLGLLITVDQGIVANEALRFLKSRGIQVVVSDHHEPGKSLPEADVIVHTTKTSGSGVAWLMGYQLGKVLGNPDKLVEEGLALAAIGTVADVLPLTGFNRSLVWHGLAALRRTSRPGLLSLFETADLQVEELEAYHIGFQIGPRINAMGRLHHARAALDLLLSTNLTEGKALAQVLEKTNQDRQKMTDLLVRQALASIEDPGKLIIIHAKDYDEGVMGLIAGKLVERFYRPAIVICEQEGVSKGSCRSVRGFNMVEFLRRFEGDFVGVGGHAMAAGFSVVTETLAELKSRLSMEAEESVLEEWLVPRLAIDCKMPLSGLSFRLHELFEQMAPFGMGNQKPVLCSTGIVRDVKPVGREGKHLKLVMAQGDMTLDAIGFGLGDRIHEVKVGKAMDFAYTLDVNVWRGKRSLQLMVKDFKKSE